MVAAWGRFFVQDAVLKDLDLRPGLFLVEADELLNSRSFSNHEASEVVLHDGLVFKHLSVDGSEDGDEQVEESDGEPHDHDHPEEPDEVHHHNTGLLLFL